MQKVPDLNEYFNTREYLKELQKQRSFTIITEKFYQI